MAAPEDGSTWSEQTGARCVESALAGDLGAADALLSELDAAGGDATSWAAAGRAARWLAGPSAGTWPRLDEIAAARDASPAQRGGAAVAAALAAKVAALRFDDASLGRWSDLSTELARGARGLAPLHARASGVWRDVLAGRSDDAASGARSLVADARAAGVASLVVDATALGALALLDAGRVDDALAEARRASRMAQAEALPQQEYLAHIVLARTRRTTGRSHLATRILTALRRVAPAQWRGWIDWELVLAGGPGALPSQSGDGSLEPLVFEGLEDRAVRGVDALRDTIAAATQGEARRFEQAGARASAAVDGWAALARELGWLRAGADPTAQPGEVPAELRPWCEGRAELPPGGIHGACVWTEGSPEPVQDIAVVLAQPDGTARRMLRIAAELARRPDLIDLTERRQARNDTTLAVLALAGPPGLPDKDLFREVYGFDYVPSRHDAVLGVLIHRVRERLGRAGTVIRESGVVALDLGHPLLLLDPRCTRTVDDRLVHLLARSGRGSARTVSRELGLPLRTVQGALKELVTEGVCRRERAGRRIEYVIEDTTFHEPTRH